MSFIITFILSHIECDVHSKYCNLHILAHNILVFPVNTATAHATSMLANVAK